MGVHIVEIWDRKVEVSTHQKSKSVWIASCVYLNKSYEAKGQSERAAVAACREKARYHTN